MFWLKSIIYTLSLTLAVILWVPVAAQQEVGAVKITSEEALGSVTYEGLIQLAQTIVAQDREAFNKMFETGRATALPPGTEVYVLETRDNDRIYHVRPKGSDVSIWLPKGALK